MIKMNPIKKIIDVYRSGEEKATLENKAERWPMVDIAGESGPELDALVDNLYKPYNEMAEKARNIKVPEGLVKRLVFTAGYIAGR